MTSLALSAFDGATPNGTWTLFVADDDDPDTADDGGSTFECNLDGVGWNDCKSPVKLKRLSVGKHKLEVRATDPSGNRGAPAKVTVRVLPKPKS